MNNEDRVQSEIDQMPEYKRTSSLANIALTLAQHLDNAETKEAASLARALVATLDKLGAYDSRDDGKSFVGDLFTPVGNQAN